MTYLVNFFWDRVLRAVFNSCRQIPLTYFNAGNQLTPNSTMDDMHRSSKSGQGVWQLIQGIQETSWSWFKTKGISWTAKYQFDREDSQKDVIIFSLELFWIQELPSAAMRRFRQPFLGIDFPDILRNCSIAVFQYNRIMSEIVISFSNHIRISCYLSSGHVLETCFEFLWVRRQGQDHCFGSIWEGIRITGHHRAPASAWSQQRLSGSTSFTPVRQMCNVVDLPKARQDPMWDMAPNKASETKVRSVTWGLKHVYNWQISFFLDFLRLQLTTPHSN